MRIVFLAALTLAAIEVVITNNGLWKDDEVAR